MTPEILAFLEVFLLAAGALAAFRFTRFMSRSNGRNVVLMAGVAAWAILFGLLPFMVFALLVNRAAGGPVGWFPALILNLIPFALVTGPFLGFVQGMLATRSRGA